jgi:hypothetical protein
MVALAFTDYNTGVATWESCNELNWMNNFPGIKFLSMILVVVVVVVVVGGINPTYM